MIVTKKKKSNVKLSQLSRCYKIHFTSSGLCGSVLENSWHPGGREGIFIFLSGGTIFPLLLHTWYTEEAGEGGGRRKKTSLRWWFNLPKQTGSDAALRSTCGGWLSRSERSAGVSCRPPPRPPHRHFLSMTTSYLTELAAAAPSTLSRVFALSLL